MTSRALLAAAAITASLALSPALAEPPPDAKIDQVLKDFEAAWVSATSREDIQKAAVEVTKGLTLDDLTPVQIGRLLSFQGLIDPLGGAPAAWDRLETFLPDRGVDGATAAVHTLTRRLQAAETDDARLEIFRSAITHPGLEAAIAADGVTQFFNRIRSAGPLAPQAADEIMGLERLLTPELAPKLATSFTTFFELAKAAVPDDKARTDALRAKLVDAGRSALPKLSEREAEYVSQNIVDYLDGAFAKGTLMNGPAPSVEILWSSDPSVATGPATLAALKGRVVVLDFWATWCGPCVGSIPKVRELAARYEGYPVTIIGVTSIQGNHYPGDGAPIDTKGDPDKEFALMADYIKQKDITWPIVFTKQSCFNGAYGVRGIPHVAMIDPAGNVRHNGLHPGAPLADKAALIDALLKEANLPTPDPIPAESGSDDKPSKPGA